MRFAVITIAHDEEVIIDHFLGHYLRHGASAIVLIDNDCTDRTVSRAQAWTRVLVQRLASGELDDALRTVTFQRAREGCAGCYDWVLLVDCDEFITPKAHATIREALAASPDASVLGTHGWDVVQRPGDPAIDWNQPLLGQRHFGIANDHYDKPVVLRPGGRERLMPGQHYLCGARRQPALHPFWLLHLAACDEQLYFTRRRRMTARQGLNNIRHRLSTQHTHQSEDDLGARWHALQHHPAIAPLPIWSAHAA